MPSKELEELLIRFSGPANRTLLHPTDDKRFWDVIRAGYRWERVFSGQDLKDWLTHDGWPAAAAIDLVKLFVDGKLLQAGQ